MANEIISAFAWGKQVRFANPHDTKKRIIAMLIGLYALNGEIADLIDDIEEVLDELVELDILEEKNEK